MHLYIAGYTLDKNIHEVKEATHLLESFLCLQKKDFKQFHSKKKILGRKLFLDSGAFSAFTQGKVIDLDVYIEYIKKYEPYLEVYAGLDVIGDYKATRKNIEYMESKGLSPLPTFHFKSPISELRRMIKKYDYIALGGLVPLKLNRALMQKWLDKCFAVINEETLKKGKPLTKVHGFGVNALWAWKRYPFYSVDATSWLTGGKFRRIVKFQKGKLVAFSKKRGGDDIEVAKVTNDHYIKLNRSNIREYTKAAQYATRLWKERGITF